MRHDKPYYTKQKERIKEQWKTRREAGLCGRCGGDLQGSKTSLCPQCVIKSRKSSKLSYEKKKFEKSEFYRERYKQRRSSGICVSCGKAPAVKGIARCDACQQKQREASIRFQIKKCNERKAANG